MIIRHSFLGAALEIHWFEEEAWRRSQAEFALLRCASPPRCEEGQTILLRQEATQVIDLSPGVDAWLDHRPKKIRHQIRQGLQDYAFRWAETEKEREGFYAVYAPFAKRRGLPRPHPADEKELDILLAYDGQGQLAQAAAFLPIRRERRYRYRYGWHASGSQAGRAILHQAMVHAYSRDLRLFDLGGVTPGAKSGSPAAGINAFKTSLGGDASTTWLFLRCHPLWLRLPLRLLGRLPIFVGHSP